MLFVRVAGLLLIGIVLFCIWDGLYWPSYGAVAAGSAVAAAGILLRVVATRHGKARPRELLTLGPYARCRHPRYLGTWLVCLGVVIMLMGGTLAAAPFLWMSAVVLMGFIAWLHVPAGRYETLEMIHWHGVRAMAYRDAVPPFIPRLNGSPFELDQSL
jgi:protein-S-isoprenylcysteine O-methyltransferase Ste14